MGEGALPAGGRVGDRGGEGAADMAGLAGRSGMRQGMVERVAFWTSRPRQAIPGSIVRQTCPGLREGVGRGRLGGQEAAAIGDSGEGWGKGSCSSSAS